MIGWRFIFFLVIMVCVAPNLRALGHQSSDTTAFSLVKTSDGVSLYERWYSTAGGDRARELRARFFVKADPMAAVALIRDERRGTGWNTGTKIYRVVSSDSAAWLCHIEYNLPWPLSDQECVLLFNERFEDRCVEVAFRGVDHPAFTARRNVQRIEDISGKWIFIRTQNGIAVEYFITTKPSSTLPAWVTDPIIRSNLISTLTSFRAILEAGSH
jgi:hypothetical protein